VPRQHIAEKKHMIQRIQIGARLSQAVVHGNTVYLAGIVADDAKADVPEQTGQILKKIDDLLKAAGTSKEKILTAQIWLSEIRYFDQMNSVWDPWIPKGHTPARACIESKLAFPDLKVEIMVTAAIG
jgi:enamine deaminase RidA (YjgF/YER057c/UK114 family)